MQKQFRKIIEYLEIIKLKEEFKNYYGIFIIEKTEKEKIY